MKQLSKHRGNGGNWATITEAFMDVNVGRMDAVVIDEVVGKILFKQEPDLYTVLGEDFGVKNTASAFASRRGLPRRAAKSYR
jgi:ABC-type amino acid transport substrate-binding protein